VTTSFLKGQGRGYEFAAPVDENGHLLADEWRARLDQCRVKRFWPGQKNEFGHLAHRRGGSWAFDYDANRGDDDEPDSSSIATTLFPESTSQSPSMMG